jgi:gas vesicle protein
LTPAVIPVKVYNIPHTFRKETSMENDYRKIAGAFLVGGLIGAAVALLYAPKSGRATRKDISKTARRIKKETVHLVEDAVDSINDFTGEVRDKVTDVIERGKDLSDGAKKEIIRNLEHGQKVIEKQKKRIVEALGI